MALKDIPLPQDKPKTEWEFIERQAYIYHLITEAGHVDLIPTYKELGKDFGVTLQQIAKDKKKALKEVLDDHPEQFKRVPKLFYPKAVKDCIKRKKYQEANNLILGWSAVQAKDKLSGIPIELEISAKLMFDDETRIRSDKKTGKVPSVEE